MRNRRLVSGLTVAIALAPLLGWLAGPAAAQGAGWTLPTRPITLTYWDSADNVKNELLAKKLIPEYQKLHPNVTIRYEVIAGLAPKMLVALSTGTAPELFEVADFLLPIVLETSVLDPLPPEAWGQTSVDGVVNTYLPAPARHHDPARQAVRRAGPDERPQPLHQQPPVPGGGPGPGEGRAEDLGRRGEAEQGADQAQGRPRRPEGVGDALRGGALAVAHVPHPPYQAGGDVIRDGKPVFNTEAGLKALAVWKSVSVAPQVTQNTAASPYMDFAMEQDAMTFAGPNGGASIEKVNPQMKGNYTVARLPAIQADRPATVVYSYNWAVNAKAPDDAKKVAWDFIRFASTRPAEWMATASTCSR